MEPRVLIRKIKWRFGSVIKITRKQAVSLRAPLIPTISHTLSGALYPNVQSTVLRSKLELVYRRHADGQELAVLEEEVRDDSQLRVRAISASVWRLLARETFDPKAGRELRSMVKENCNNSYDSADKMLFGMQAQAGGMSGLHDDDLFVPSSDGCSEPDDYLICKRDNSVDSSDESSWDGESDRGSLLFEKRWK
jgi:hypothetical protein